MDSWLAYAGIKIGLDLIYLNQHVTIFIIYNAGLVISYSIKRYIKQHSNCVWQVKIYYIAVLFEVIDDTAHIAAY
ncbi:hypothetical protein Cyrtocomes_00338 [Candidatus Cyrtobacter comes]|uniref:Uncharacterized protein n=1 Tax=Candidatus Cyrtobacter comes TaxID=675776 RepID=A0ABU5L769_9RICK|nr:hypothetical protein [Candidatus Cyrtobacter comes]